MGRCKTLPNIVPQPDLITTHVRSIVLLEVATVLAGVVPIQCLATGGRAYTETWYAVHAKKSFGSCGKYHVALSIGASIFQSMDSRGANMANVINAHRKFFSAVSHDGTASLPGSIEDEQKCMHMT